MPVVFSDHAKLQLKKRQISQTVVRKVVISPYRIIPSFKGRKLRQKRVGDKLLEVVTRTEGSRITVVTAYYLKENL